MASYLYSPLTTTLLLHGVLLHVLVLVLVGVSADLLVVLLEGGDVLACLGELALLHALAHIPMDEGSLGIVCLLILVRFLLPHALAYQALGY